MKNRKKVNKLRGTAQKLKFTPKITKHNIWKVYKNIVNYCKNIFDDYLDLIITFRRCRNWIKLVVDFPV